MSERSIATGGPDDTKALVTTLAAAFQEDPAFSFILPDPEKRRAKLKRFFDIAVREDLAAGAAHHSPAFEVTTLWRAPGRHKEEPLGSFRTFLSFATIFGTGLGRGGAVAGQMAKHHPQSRHWYLRYAGVVPDAQGKGWGGLALKAGIAMAEADGLPIYLETAKLENVGLYQRFGFAITQEWDVPGGGPHFWGMMRG